MDGSSTSGVWRRSASRLSSRRGALPPSCRATVSSRPVQVGVDRLEHRARAADPAGAGGQHPRDVRGARQRELVGFAGQGAAVDHGQRVVLARVGQDQLDPLPGARGREPRAGREHPQAGGGGEQPADRQPGGHVVGHLDQRARRLHARIAGDPAAGSAGVADQHRRRAPARLGQRDEIGERARARAAAQAADRQQRPADGIVPRLGSAVRCARAGVVLGDDGQPRRASCRRLGVAFARGGRVGGGHAGASSACRLRCARVPRLASAAIAAHTLPP